MFLKWAGSKRSLIPALLERVPEQITSYGEPFLGGGALFFALAESRKQRIPSALSDVNLALIAAYIEVQSSVPFVVTALQQRIAAYESSADKAAYFARARRDFNSPESERYDRAGALAADFIFLNYTCFNGLFRVNKKGEFNVPWGKKAKVGGPNEFRLTECSRHLRDAALFTADFEGAIDRFTDLHDGKPGAFMYLDPPYLGTFSGYSGTFEESDHRRLVQKCHQLTEAGIPFLLSNSEAAASLYRGFDVELLDVPCRIAASARSRGTRAEILVRNGKVWL